MKYLIASDIHGSAACTRALLERFQAEEADVLVLLGDILYHGPRNDLPEAYAPKEVAALLNAMADKILCVRGNCEAEVDQMMLDFPCLADYAYLYIEGTPVYMTHGHHFNDQNLPKIANPRTILLHGHTHVPVNLHHVNHRTMKPGSTTIPKQESPRSYMLIDGTHIYWKHLEDGSVYMEDVL